MYRERLIFEAGIRVWCVDHNGPAGRRQEKPAALEPPSNLRARRVHPEKKKKCEEKSS
jgi:hypothetical protein